MLLSAFKKWPKYNTWLLIAKLVQKLQYPLKMHAIYYVGIRLYSDWPIIRSFLIVTKRSREIPDEYVHAFHGMSKPFLREKIFHFCHAADLLQSHAYLSVDACSCSRVFLAFGLQ